jgi:hypothetical protein
VVSKLVAEFVEAAAGFVMMLGIIERGAFLFQKRPGGCQRLGVGREPSGCLVVIGGAAGALLVHEGVDLRPRGLRQSARRVA